MYETLKCPACGEMLQFQPVKMEGDGIKPAAEPVTTEEAKTMPLKELRDKLPKKSEE